MEQIYVDGSYKNEMFGYGVYIDSGSHDKREHCGREPVVNKSISMLHEQLALLHGALFAISKGINPSNCTFHTDQVGLSDRQQASSLKYRAAYLNGLLQCRSFLRTSEFNKALVFLEQSTIKWVRGHSDSINNRRADHLAKRGREGVETTPYDNWLKALVNRRDTTVHE